MNDNESVEQPEITLTEALAQIVVLEEKVKRSEGYIRHLVNLPCGWCGWPDNITEKTDQDETFDLKAPELISLVNTPRVIRLRTGNWQFGCSGKHRGNGSVECPFELHHHHDDCCKLPSTAELMAAGINPHEFRPRTRA